MSKEKRIFLNQYKDDKKLANHPYARYISSFLDLARGAGSYFLYLVNVKSIILDNRFIIEGELIWLASVKSAERNL